MAIKTRKNTHERHRFFDVKTLKYKRKNIFRGKFLKVFSKFFFGYRKLVEVFILNVF